MINIRRYQWFFLAAIALVVAVSSFVASATIAATAKTTSDVSGSGSKSSSSLRVIGKPVVRSSGISIRIALPSKARVSVFSVNDNSKPRRVGSARTLQKGKRNLNIKRIGSGVHKFVIRARFSDGSMATARVKMNVKDVGSRSDQYDKDRKRTESNLSRSSGKRQRSKGSSSDGSKHRTTRKFDEDFDEDFDDSDDGLDDDASVQVVGQQSNPTYQGLLNAEPPTDDDDRAPHQPRPETRPRSDDAHRHAGNRNRPQVFPALEILFDHDGWQIPPAGIFVGERQTGEQVGAPGFPFAVLYPAGANGRPVDNDGWEIVDFGELDEPTGPRLSMEEQRESQRQREVRAAEQRRQREEAERHERERLERERQLPGKERVALAKAELKQAQQELKSQAEAVTLQQTNFYKFTVGIGQRMEHGVWDADQQSEELRDIAPFAGDILRRVWNRSLSDRPMTDDDRAQFVLPQIRILVGDYAEKPLYYSNWLTDNLSHQTVAAYRQHWTDFEEASELYVERKKEAQNAQRKLDDVVRENAATPEVSQAFEEHEKAMVAYEKARASFSDGRNEYQRIINDIQTVLINEVKLRCERARPRFKAQAEHAADILCADWNQICDGAVDTCGLPVADPSQLNLGALADGGTGVNAGAVLDAVRYVDDQLKPRFDQRKNSLIIVRDKLLKRRNKLNQVRSKLAEYGQPTGT